MKGIYSNTRVNWVHKVLGRDRSLTVGHLRQAFRQMAERGWITAFSTEGPAYEHVAMVRTGHALHAIVLAYSCGRRLFERTAVERAIADSVASLTGAATLAKAGFAVRSTNGPHLELAAIDPRSARMINESRRGRQERGYGVRPVIETFQSLRKPPRGSIHVTDVRRLEVEEILRDSWAIRCPDLLTERRRVRFLSDWVFHDDFAATG